MKCPKTHQKYCISGEVTQISLPLSLKKYSSSLFLRELVLLIQELTIPLYNQNISGYPTARSLTDLRLPIDVHCIGI